jgi:acetyl esterase/lipase
MLTRREFALLGGAGVATLNKRDLLSACVRTEGPAKRVAVPQPVRVNPELQSAVAELKARMRTPLNAETLAVARKAWVAPAPLAHPSWHARIIPGLGRAPGVRVYVIGESPGGAPRPAILYIHGGGYVLGTAKDYIPTLQKRSLALDCVCVSVDYRLAPETRFPGSLEDIYAALTWLYRNAETLGVDRSKLAVMGDSAGGGHAAMLAIAVRDRGEIPIVLQSLLYPMLDDRTGSTRKVPSFIGTLLWNAQMNRFGWSALLGEPAGSRRVPYGSVPARLTDLQGLAPAFIGVGSIDLFVDEDTEYARRLINADVPTELHVVAGAFHAFDGIVPNAPISKEFDTVVNRALARAFGRTPIGFSSPHV